VQQQQMGSGDAGACTGALDVRRTQPTQPTPRPSRAHSPQPTQSPHAAHPEVVKPPQPGKGGAQGGSVRPGRHVALQDARPGHVLLHLLAPCTRACGGVSASPHALGGSRRDAQQQWHRQPLNWQVPHWLF